VGALHSRSASGQVPWGAGAAVVLQNVTKAWLRVTSAWTVGRSHTLTHVPSCTHLQMSGWEQHVLPQGCCSHEALDYAPPCLLAAAAAAAAAVVVAAHLVSSPVARSHEHSVSTSLAGSQNSAPVQSSLRRHLPLGAV